ncbi:MAG: hypothetical protein M3N27_02610 [Thermoproteota archaeon]|nr:hypothetical protein [Thermoproteota archaeon]
MGIKPDSVEATLGQRIEPCVVLRKDPLLIEGIPEYNVFGLSRDRLITYDSKIEICHGGFWMLIRPERLKTGDHFLKWKIESVYHNMNVQLRINSLT